MFEWLRGKLRKDAAKTAPVKAEGPADGHDFFTVHANPFGEERVLGSLGGVHFSDIEVDLGMMPKVELEHRPHHSEYLRVKRQLADEAYHMLRPYVDYAKALPGVAGHPDLPQILEHLVGDAIVRYWDMPSSYANHHSHPWGHLVHSLHQACAGAEEGAKWQPFTRHGVDQVALKKYQGFVVVMGFLRGLYHDAYKIYQVQIESVVKGRQVIFQASQITAQILDFKIAYPGAEVKGWNKLTVHPGRINTFEMFMRVPRKLLCSTPPEVYVQLINSLLDVESSAEDVSEAIQSTVGDQAIADKVARAVANYFTVRSATKPEKYVYSVNEVWTGVHYDQFVEKVGKAVGYATKESFAAYLAARGVLFAIDRGKAVRYSMRTAFSLRFRDGEEHERAPINLAFVSTQFLLDCAPNCLAGCGEAWFPQDSLPALEHIAAEIHDHFLVAQAPAEAILDSAVPLGKVPETLPTGNPDSTLSVSEVTATEPASPPLLGELQPGPPASPVGTEHPGDPTGDLAGRLQKLQAQTGCKRICDPESGWGFVGSDGFLYLRVPQVLKAMVPSPFISDSARVDEFRDLIGFLASAGVLWDPTPEWMEVEVIQESGERQTVSGDFLLCNPERKDEFLFVAKIPQGVQGA